MQMKKNWTTRKLISLSSIDCKFMHSSDNRSTNATLNF